MAPSIADADFGELRDFIRERFGVYYDDGKRSLLESRLRSRLIKRGIDDYGTYLHFLRTDRHASEELDELASVLTNNETRFFRHRGQFKALSGPIVDSILAGRESQDIRVWSAGCSSGEEPYSLGIELLRSGRFTDGAIDVRGTDISPRALRAADANAYRKASMRNVDDETMRDYFRHDDEAFSVIPRVRNLVKFSRLNLVDLAAIEGFGIFDAVFCRNCLIYFHRTTQKIVAEAFAKVLRPGGFLFLGHAESLFHLTDRFEPVVFADAVVYRVKA